MSTFIFQITNVDAGAYDLYRKTELDKGNKVPRWLSMSENSKNECRKEFYKWARTNMNLNFSDSQIDHLINQVSTPPAAVAWINSELAAEIIQQDNKSNIKDNIINEF